VADDAGSTDRVCATRRNSDSVEMNALHFAQMISEADETISGKTIVGLPHWQHAKSWLTCELLTLKNEAFGDL
jgi:hypothetical protein